MVSGHMMNNQTFPSAPSPPRPASLPELRGRVGALLNDRRFTFVAVVALTLLALGLRLYQLSTHSYWDDEIVTSIAARPPVGTIFWSSSTYSPHHLPLYYIIVHLWMSLGDGLVMLRMPSVLMGTACVPLLYLLGRELLPAPVPLIAAALLAVSPNQIVHSQQARMYPLLTLVVIIATLLFLRAWRNGGWLRWLWFGLSMMVGFSTHIYAPFSLLAFPVWALLDSLRQRRFEASRWVGLIAAQALGVVAFLPLVPGMLHTVASTKQPFWIASNTPFDWMPALIECTSGATFIMQAYRDHPVRDLFFFVGLGSMVVGATAVLLTLWYSVREARRDPAERPTWLLLHALLWTPVAVATFISLTIKPILVSRYLIGISPPLLLLMAWMVVRCWRVRGVRVLALLFAASVGAVLVFVYPDAPRPNQRVALVTSLIEQQEPGDAIAYGHWHLFDTSFAFYPDAEDVYVLPGPAQDVAFWSRRVAYMGWNYPDHIQPVSEFAPRYRRVWLALNIYDYDFEHHRQVHQSWLEQHGRLVERVVFDEGTTVWGYEVVDEDVD
ncbi:MAG: hypothetical protein HC884_12250 [Chloroflexaceae bacterium]|nr:hypothetical protein [Chloroflexaceae bacterium]